MSRVKRTPPKPPPAEKPSALEYSVAGYMRENVPRKKTKFLHHPVEYFTASRAVDALLDSPWASGSEKQPPLFTDRDSVVEFLDGMLRRKFFHRAKKVAISDRDLRRKQLKKLKKLEEEEKKKLSTRGGGGGGDSESEHDDRRVDDRSNAEETAGEKSAVEGEASPKASGKDADEARPKRRIKLDMHLEQLFVDGSDAYVWIYDPIPTYYWLLGMLIVAAIVAICLFPLWPSKMREYVYYLSVAAAGFLVVILALAVVRLVVFCLLWVATWGRHQLWLLPNLTEDVGFFASFWPLYQYEYHGKKDQGSPEKTKKKKADKRETGSKVKWDTKKDEAVGEEEAKAPGDEGGEQAEICNDTPHEEGSDSDPAE